jgi:hypothetical protein
MYPRDEKPPHPVSTMAFTKARSRLGVTAACAGLLVFISGCGSDSTGPSRLEPSAALQSLALGMRSLLVAPSPIPGTMDESFGGIAPLLDQIDVTIDGKSQTMFAIGTRETFPEGTCLEDVFIFPSMPPLDGVCTPPDLGLGLILWQSHSAFAPPDRMILVVGDIGTIDFNSLAILEYTADGTAAATSGVAIYLEGEDKFWISQSGTLTSQVAATSQSCGLTLPPYAKSASCSIATFNEQGAITFEGFTETGPSTERLTVTIPRQTLHGLWLAITETQPITVPEFQRSPRWPGFQLGTN